MVRQRTALWITAVYAAAAALWIFLSDEVLRRLVGDPAVAVRLQTPKGWFFIAVTAGLLYSLLRRRTALISAVGRTLEERERLLRTVLDAVPVAIVGFDGDQRVRLWNAASEALLGWTAAEAIGGPIPYLRAEEIPEFRRLFARVLRGEPFGGVEIRRHRKDGTPLDLLLYTAPLRGEGEVGIRVIGILVDVTERKRLEAQLRQAQKLEAIGLLAAGVAHDFRNILTVVMATAEATQLALSDASPQVTQDLIELSDAARRGADITRRLLAFTRMEPMALKPVELAAVVRDLEGVLRRLVPEDVELVIDASGTALVWADANAIGQMLVNLAANARDAMTGSGGSVRVSVGVRAVAAVEIPADALVVPGRFVTIEVRDTGTGMDEATLARAFDPFFTTKAAGLGTGLGLPMVKGLMAEHGGFVQIESAPGQGTIVRLLFCPADGEETAAGALPDEAPRKGTETILIAEDEEALRRVATRALEQLGYRVLTAADGQEALVLYHAHADEIDLVISDSVMPRLGGIAFHETLRREGSRVRFLLASGYAPDDRGRHGDVGVPFLAKPWTLSELTAKVREVLDGPAPR